MIVTQQLESTLVYLNPASTEPGLRVKGLGAKGELAQYECLGGAEDVEVLGEILVKQTGNTESAGSETTDSVQEGPLRLQSNVYEGAESAQTEEAAKAFFLWGEKFQTCIVEQLEKGAKSQAEAEAICFGIVGPPPATKPVMLESLTSLGTAPTVQNGMTENKGEKEILTTLSGSGGKPPPSASVVGTVTETPAKPAAGANISICGTGGCYGAESEADGSYKISGVADGTTSPTSRRPRAAPTAN